MTSRAGPTRCGIIRGGSASHALGATTPGRCRARLRVPTLGAKEQDTSPASVPRTNGPTVPEAGCAGGLSCPWPAHRFVRERLGRRLYGSTELHGGFGTASAPLRCDSDQQGRDWYIGYQQGLAIPQWCDSDLNRIVLLFSHHLFQYLDGVIATSISSITMTRSLCFQYLNGAIET